MLDDFSKDSIHNGSLDIMDLSIDILSENRWKLYNEFILTKTHIYSPHQSEKWLKMLKNVLNDELKVITAYNGNEIVAVFPLMIRKRERGSVINSLPLSGSPGGIILKMGISDDMKLKIINRVKDYFDNYILKDNILSYTIIQTPMSEITRDDYIKLIDPDYVYDRITQYTDLETDELNYRPEVRNRIRRAIRKNVIIDDSIADSKLEEFWLVYKDNMERKNLAVKSISQFKNYIELFGDSVKYKLALFDNKVIGGIVYFIFGKHVFLIEVVYKKEYGSLQPCTLAIDSALKECKQNGFKYWNFGASDKKDNGVYIFKSKFGPFEVYYSYFTKILQKEKLKILGLDYIKSEFAWYYTAPYDFFKQIS
ncbi:MAG: GNAT family N-acetyltransferase [Candidatus Hydrogenedentota bacterium]